MENKKNIELLDILNINSKNLYSSYNNIYKHNSKYFTKPIKIIEFSGKYIKHTHVMKVFTQKGLPLKDRDVIYFFDRIKDYYTNIHWLSELSIKSIVLNNVIDENSLFFNKISIDNIEKAYNEYDVYDLYLK